MIRAVVVGVLIVLSPASAAANPAGRPVDRDAPVRIMRCTLAINDVLHAIESIEIFRAGSSDLGLFVITSTNGSRQSAFAHLSLSHDSEVPYLQALQAMRPSDTQIGFNFLAKVGSDQRAVLRRTGVDRHTEDLHLVCDSPISLVAAR